jgi:hypothetical protein
MCRKLGITLFNKGNTNFEGMVKEHECNHFCHFYQLPPLQTIVKKVSDDDDDSHPKPYQPPPSVMSPPSDDDLPETPFVNQPEETKELEEAKVFQSESNTPD